MAGSIGIEPKYRVRGTWAGASNYTSIQSTPLGVNLVTAFSVTDIASTALLPSGDVLELSIDSRVSDETRRLQSGTATVNVIDESGFYVNSGPRLGDLGVIYASVDSGTGVFADYVNGAYMLDNEIYPLFRGYVQSFTLDPEIGQRGATITFEDETRRLRKTLSTGFLNNLSVSSFFSIVASLANVANANFFCSLIGDPIFAVGYDQVAAGDIWSDAQTAAAALSYVSAQGKLSVRDRNYDVSSGVSYTRNAAWLMSGGLSDDNLINKSNITITPRQESIDVGTVGWIENPVFIGAQATVSFIIGHVDPATQEADTPCTDFEPSVLNLDYKLNSQNDGLGTDIASAFSVVTSHAALSSFVTLTNSGGTNGYAVVFQVRGKAYARLPELTATAINSASINQYDIGQEDVTTSIIPTFELAQGRANYEVMVRAQPRPIVSADFRNDWPLVCTLDHLSAITLQSSRLAVNSKFFIFGRTHHITFDQGTSHQVSYDTRLAFPKVGFILDSSTLGRLDVSLLGT